MMERKGWRDGGGEGGGSTHHWSSDSPPSHDVTPHTSANRGGGRSLNSTPPLPPLSSCRPSYLWIEYMAGANRRRSLCGKNHERKSSLQVMSLPGISERDPNLAPSFLQHKSTYIWLNNLRTRRKNHYVTIGACFSCIFGVNRIQLMLSRLLKVHKHEN
jgi:hypothetical protein